MLWLPVFTILVGLGSASASSACQAPLPSPAVPVQPTVTFTPSDGLEAVIAGTTLDGINTYHGIPFAAAPVGDLRFQPPQDYRWNISVWNATRQSPACIQTEDEKYTTKYGMSEDCLFLSVLTPSILPEEPVPVMVWVYGGSWVSGSSSYYDGSWLVSQSVETDRPVIYVGINYRLGYFGFPFGAEAQQEGASNLGQRDIIKALEWTRNNIAAFGGDPKRVTAYGESAGSVSVALLFLQPELDLFQNAIMQSGSPSTFPMGASGEVWLEAYDLLLELSGCQVGGNHTAGGFQCLKDLPAVDLLAAQTGVQADTRYHLPLIFTPSIDGDIVPASPHKLLAAGAFARKPFINGVMRDEGTLFVPNPVPPNVSESMAAYSTLEPEAIDPRILDELFTDVYPDEPALGSPFGTGNEMFGQPSTYKQFAAMFGDRTWQSSRRLLFEQARAHNLTQTWTYQMDVRLPTYPPALGACHSVDLTYSFGDAQLAYTNATSERAEWARSFNLTKEHAALSRTAVDYWINFAHFGNPNGDGTIKGDAALPLWPEHGQEKNMLEMALGGVQVISDTFREDQIKWFLDRPEVFHY